MPLTASIISPSELDDDCIRRWEELRTSRSCYASPFYSPRFAILVGAVRRDAKVAVFERDQEIVGFLPFHLVGKTVAKPICGHMNDYQGPVLERSICASDSTLLKAAGLSVYDFNHLPAEIYSAAAKGVDNGASPQMNLEDGYDTCVATKGASWKRGHSDFMRKQRKMHRELGTLQFQFDNRSAGIREIHKSMRNALYRKMGLNSQFSTGWEGEVLDLLSEANGPDFASVMNVLFADDTPVAAHFGLVSNGVMHWWFPAYAEHAHRYSPGLSLIDFCARAAAQNGISTIDFGRGSERYKTLFADRAVPLLAGSLSRPGSAKAMIRRAAQAAIPSLEKALPKSIEAVPRKLCDRLFAGVSIPRTS